ncbi:MAG: hypothetical protein BGO97_00365 [Micrococcales bacterium 70-64]|nr:MAG: hypothetical protein ABT06_00365 [Leifsonia sp. SCN 70-46]OJX84312.1 MAG: hypothetical protein BGO97_00365 [Micrococcales bacterium 70-64]
MAVAGGGMSVPLRAAALAASLALLTACGPAPELPAALTDAQVKARIAEGNAQWWQSMFPGEPMPEVEVVQYVDQDSAAKVIQDCVRAAHLDDVVFSPDFSWIYLGDDPAVVDQLNRQYFVCSLEYQPDPAELGYLSDAQLEFDFYYNRDRLVPCLQLLGYSVINRTTDYVPGDYWNPYYEMYPLPTAAEWARVDVRCPPDPVGPVYRPTSGGGP